MSEVKKVLIIGISGGLAQILARLMLQEHTNVEIIGVDSRDTSNCQKLPRLKLITMRYSRGNFEKLFRENEFYSVYHLARMSHSLIGHQENNKRLEIGLMGTSRIIDLSLRFNVKKCIILSTFHVYGALPDNSIFLKEDSPLKASMKYAELRDVVEMDQICTNWIWMHQKEMTTVVLRPCNIIGKQIQNTMSEYLNSRYALNPVDYNPVFQFIHEFDMANVLMRSMEEVP